MKTGQSGLFAEKRRAGKAAGLNSKEMIEMAAGLPVERWIALLILFTSPVGQGIPSQGIGLKPVASIERALPALDPPVGGLTQRLDDEMKDHLARARSA